jgi:biopolymer transport protein ExbB
MQAEYLLDNLKFITQGGAVSIAVAAGLLLMSIGSWYIMLIKALQMHRLRRANARFSEQFWASPSLGTAMNGSFNRTATPFARLAIQSLRAADHHRRHAGQRSEEACSHDEFIARALHRAIGQENMQLETGLTLLASVGSIAPFVGLFGTVWGIYHALGSIAASGQATIDKVAGPVGEALIMTAFGLAVAIPAVLAYNALVRNNRLLMGDVEAFAHDMHIYLTTGATLESSAHPADILHSPASADKDDTNIHPVNYKNSRPVQEKGKPGATHSEALL